MSNKDFWKQHENIPPNVIGMFENDLMYGRVVSVLRRSAKKFDFMIEWDMLRLIDIFHIAWYFFCTSVYNTHALKVHI